jgi:hypothetical protein
MMKAVPSIEKLNEFAQGPFRKSLEEYQQRAQHQAPSKSEHGDCTELRLICAAQQWRRKCERTAQQWFAICVRTGD